MLHLELLLVLGFLRLYQKLVVLSDVLPSRSLVIKVLKPELALHLVLAELVLQPQLLLVET